MYYNTTLKSGGSVNIDENTKIRNLRINLLNCSELCIIDAPVNVNREDRGVLVSNDGKKFKRSSNIMMGFNKNHVKLENGNYISWEQIKPLILEYVDTIAENESLINRNTGARIEKTELVSIISKRIEENHSSIILRDNKYSKKLSIKQSGYDEKEIKKGMLMLGKKNNGLANGVYYTRDSIREVLNEYAIAEDEKVDLFSLYDQEDKEKRIIELNKAKEEKISTEKESVNLYDLIEKETEANTSIDDNVGQLTSIEEEQEEIQVKEEPKTDLYELIKTFDNEEHKSEEQKEIKKEKKQEKYKIFYRFYRGRVVPVTLSLTTAAIMVASMFGSEKIVKHIAKGTEKLSYKVSQNTYKESKSKETVVDMQSFAKNIKTGENISVPAGVHYYVSSDAKYNGDAKYGTFKYDGIREPGDYNVEYISVLYKGEIQNVAYNTGINLSKVLKNEAKRLGCSIDDLEPMIHLGNGPTGWVSVNDLLDHTDKKISNKTNTILESTKDYDGVCTYSDTITIQTASNQTADIKITDKDGNLLKNGSKVKGSDGIEYQIKNLEVEEINDDKNEEKSMLTFKVGNVNPTEALTALAMAVVTGISARRKKEYIEATEEAADKIYDTVKESYDQKASSLSRLVEVQTSKGRKQIKFDDSIKEKLKNGYVSLRSTLRVSGMKYIPKTASDFVEKYNDIMDISVSKNISKIKTLFRKKR